MQLNKEEVLISQGTNNIKCNLKKFKVLQGRCRRIPYLMLLVLLVGACVMRQIAEMKEKLQTDLA